MPEIHPDFRDSNRDPAHDALSSLVLPPLPRVISHYDDFAETKQVIVGIERSSSVNLRFEGKNHLCDFRIFGDAQLVIKHVVVHWLQKYALHTVYGHFYRLRAYCSTWGWPSLAKLIVLPPSDLVFHWKLRVFPLVNNMVADGLRAMLHALAALSIGAWSPHDAASIRSSIRSPRRDKFRKLRTGNSYLPLREQAVVVDYLDHFSSSVGPATPLEELQDAALLVLCFQHAIRPGQAARLGRSSTKLYEDGSLHITIPYRKQRRGVRGKTSIRSVKLEWVPILSQLLSRNVRAGNAEVPGDSLLQLTPHEISMRIVKKLTSLKLERNATDLRHSGAQRLADAGASLEEIMLYLCQESSKVAQLYIDAAPAHGRIVNDALAISEFYNDIPALHAQGYVDPDDLRRLPPDRVVSGAPHGFLTGAVGGCTTGQSMCSRSPVLACYGCHKFMPTNDLEVHESLLGGLRNVVESFISMWSESEDGPIFAQLRTTMDGIRIVIEGLRKSRAKLQAETGGDE